MARSKNPFYLRGYHGARLFCGRKEETSRLLSNIQNDINATLLSLRRMGKTGLIQHVFKKLQRDKEKVCIYVDIFATQSLAEFTEQLSVAILKAYPVEHHIGKKFMQFIRSFSPLISYDPLSGNPQISFSYRQSKEHESSLKGIFEFLEKQKQHTILAIDEFQQIAEYPEKNMESLLRTLIIPLNNINFIFSGSHKHLLTEMFSSAKRPFFSSTQILYLTNINRNEYAIFIKKLFRKAGRDIDNEAINFVLDWSRLHTYYTQSVCNRLYSLQQENINLKATLKACNDLLKEQEPVFFQYRNLLTNAQWNLLKAIAKEDKVFQPTKKEFIADHHLGTPALVRRSLEALLKKDMVYRNEDETRSYYRVYDCFLARWFENL